MTNTIARLADIKSALKVQGEADDAMLLALSERVSRAIERECGREFFVRPAATIYASVPNVSECLHLDVDVLSLSEVAIDTARDGTFAAHLIEGTDYYLYPETGSPKRSLILLPWSATYATWPEGSRRVRLTGDLGYSSERASAGEVGTGGIDASATTLPLAEGHDVSPGDTLIIGTEHLYVWAIGEIEDGDATLVVATVERGVNGSTAASHSAGAAIARHLYPGDLVQAVVMQVSRFYHEQQSGGSGSVGDPSIGWSFNALYPAIRDLIKPFRRGTYAVGIG